jgi:methylated-DNA-protein-cysteine methyltransferase-like protein
MTDSFFQQVYALVALVPRGKVATYGQIAGLLGRPRSARLVGWALHSLPDADGEDVPWQRVLGRGGRITLGGGTPEGGEGQALHGGSLQRRLLLEEGVCFDNRGRVDLDQCGWAGPDWPVLHELLGQAEDPG